VRIVFSLSLFERAFIHYFSVDNPNYFSINLKQLDANVRRQFILSMSCTDIVFQLFYPINNTHIGDGQLSNVHFPSHSNTSFNFPFTFKYTSGIDPGSKILNDLTSKCLANPQKQLTVDYKIKVKVAVLFITVSPTISSSASFDCPVSASQISVRISCSRQCLRGS